MRPDFVCSERFFILPGEISSGFSGRPGRSGGAEPAEQTLPVPVVVAHGVFAVATVVLVLLAALSA